MIRKAIFYCQIIVVVMYFIIETFTLPFKNRLHEVLPRWCFPGGASGKEPTCQYRRRKRCSLIPELGRYPGGGHSNPLQYSCLENPMDKGAWQATVHRVAKSWTPLKRLTTYHTHGVLYLWYDCNKKRETGYL